MSIMEIRLYKGYSGMMKCDIINISKEIRKIRIDRNLDKEWRKRNACINRCICKQSGNWK